LEPERRYPALGGRSGRDITSSRTYTGITTRPLGTNMVTKMTIITQILPSVKENNNLLNKFE